MNAFTHPSFRGRFGIARREITPPPGIYARNWGLAAHDAAEAIHQPLTLTALVITDPAAETAPLAIVALDLGWWRSVASENALASAVADAGFDINHTILALSHTHAAPSFCPHEAEKPGGELIPAYLADVSRKLTDALREARGNSVEGVLEVTSGTCPLAASRELVVGDRPVVGWSPGTPADQALLLGRITDRSGNCLATVVNYACHPTVLAWQNRAISPDFIGSMRNIVEKETNAPMVFLQGASGDLAARHQYTGDLSVVERAGKVLAHSVLSLWYGMLQPGKELGFQGIAESGAPLGLWDLRERTSPHPSRLRINPSTVCLPISATLPGMEELLAAERTTSDRALLERYHRMKLRREAVGDAAEASRACLVAQLGGIALVSISDEAYSELQTTLRRKSGEMPLFVVTLANRNLGYLVPAPLHSPEHYASRVSPYAPGSFEKIVGHLETQLDQLER